MSNNPTVGSRFELFLDVNIDLSAFSDQFIDYCSPLGVVGTWQAIQSTGPDGENGIAYQVQETDIVVVGAWTFQAWVDTGGGIHGDPVGLFVQRTLLDTGHSHP